MANRQRLLNQALEEISTQRRTEAESIEWYAGDDPELASLLRLAAATRDIPVPVPEMQRVRARARAKLLAGMAANESNIEKTPSVSNATPVSLAKARFQRREMPRLTRIACVVAAALLLSISVGWLTMYAAQAAMPGGALYSVKRGEEWVALHTAWSDERRGQVLGAITAERLLEAQTEAVLHHDAEARALTQELDADMRQLIALTAAMTATGEDASTVASALARDLNAENSAIQQARQAGLSAFADTLAASALGQQSEIEKYQISLPSAAGGNSPAHGTDTPGKGAGATTSAPSGIPAGRGATTPSGQGPGSGAGHGSGPGGQHTTPTPASPPSPTPSPSAKSEQSSSPVPAPPQKLQHSPTPTRQTEAEGRDNSDESDE